MQHIRITRFFTRAASVVLLFACLAALCGCGGKKAYRTDLDAKELKSVCEPLIEHSSNLVDATDEFLEFYLSVASALYSSFVVRRPSGSVSIDEYGVFRAVSAEAAASIEASLNAYLEGRIASWDTRYSQAEKPKVDSAVAKVYGQYVVYAILSDAERTAVFDAVDKALTAK